MRDQFNAFTSGFVDGLETIGAFIVAKWPLVVFAGLAALLFLEGR